MQNRIMPTNRFLKPVTTVKKDTYALDFSLQDVKDYLIVTHNEDDGVIQTIIDAVVSKLEQVVKRPFSYTAVNMLMEVCNATIHLPRLPIIEIDSVSIKTGKGYTGFEALTTDEYEFLGDDIILEQLGVMLVVYTAGYTPGNLPSELKNATFAEIAYRYQNRGDKTIDDGLCTTAMTYIQHLIVTSYI